MNLPAMVLVTLCCLLLVRGTRESATANTIMVLVKLAVLLLFVVIGISGFQGSNLEPFAPFGVVGIGVAASSIFFSFIGLDAVSTAGEEVRDPQRTLPLAILFATAIVTVFYVLVAIAGVGAQPYQQFEGQEAGLAAILREVTGSAWPAIILSAGAVISIFSVTLVTLYGQTRILFAMGRDGMIPPILPPREPAHPGAREEHHHRVYLRRRARRARPPERAHRPDEHGHAGRLHRRVSGRDDPALHSP